MFYEKYFFGDRGVKISKARPLQTTPPPNFPQTKFELSGKIKRRLSLSDIYSNLKKSFLKLLA
jgi:hypothetical protein